MLNFHRFDWPYFVLNEMGLLLDERGHYPFLRQSGSTPAQPVFKSIDEAEAWLERNDIRGTVRS